MLPVIVQINFMKGKIDMILDKIAESTGKRIARAKENISLAELKSMIYTGNGINSFNDRPVFAFEKALMTNKENMGFICEVKKASPSKGLIAADFPYMDIAKDYEQAGADAISVLTEPEFFLGDNKYLTDISKAVSIPVLRKDFTLDEYQIYEAKVLGADAVLLICILLELKTIKGFIALCDELGISALVEAHTENEVATALAAGARLIGVNNRNLKTFEVNINNSLYLRSLVPKDICFVAESGIKTPEDISRLKAVGVNAVLIGESLMRSQDKKEALNMLRRG